MKVLYISNALTHYYNLVLSKLNSENDVELVCITPKKKSVYVGEGVKQTKDGINFKVIELDEIVQFKLYSSFKGLADIIKKEKPDIVIVITAYMSAFYYNFSIRRSMKEVGAKLILKDIPFRLLDYSSALRQINHSDNSFNSLPSFVNTLLGKFGLTAALRKQQLRVKKNIYSMIDAHLNYIDASNILESYNVDRSSIFVMRNSPDTELFCADLTLLKVESVPPLKYIFPFCAHPPGIKCLAFRITPEKFIDP